MFNDVSQGREATPDFSNAPEGLLPAVVQDVQTGQVLMLGYMNAEAFAQTRESSKVTFFSRSKQRLWVKGEISGNYLAVVRLLSDCDADAILVKAIPQGPVCHTGDDTCWQERNESGFFLYTLADIIRRRRHDDPEQSYTARLFEAGVPKLAQKVGEEAVETVIEALVDNRERLLEESADLLFHLLALWEAKGVQLEDVEAVLRRRNKPRKPE